MNARLRLQLGLHHDHDDRGDWGEEDTLSPYAVHALARQGYYRKLAEGPQGIQYAQPIECRAPVGYAETVAGLQLAAMPGTGQGQ